MRAAFAVAAALVACGKPESNRKEERPPRKAADAAVAVDPACEESVRGNRLWLEAFHVEIASHEIDFGSTLLAIDREAEPVEQEVDNVTIKAKTIQIWDASEANRVANEVKPEDLVTGLARTLNNTEEKSAPKDFLRIDVDREATWEPVARVVEAAAEAGYTKVVFAFTASSKLTPPPGVEPRTTTREAVDAASKEIDALQSTCKPWRSAVMNHKYGTTKAENARSVAKELADALVQCNCAASVDAVKSLLWKRDRWHQAVPRVGIALTLAKDGQAIALPKATPWAEAAAKIVDASGKSVKLATL